MLPQTGSAIQPNRRADLVKLRILKCHGSSNDFVLIDEFDELLFSENERATLARILSDRRGILGSDGILFVQRSVTADVRMRMFNPDGSEAQTCGNGLRCVARFASEKLGKDVLTIEVMRGISRAKAEPEISLGVSTFSVEVAPISTQARDLPLRIPAKTLIGSILEPLSAEIPFTAVSAPNPHLIAMVDKIDYAKLTALGQKASRLPDVLPERANVSFCSVIDRESIGVATFERGTGLTMSCGSAMASSTLVACLLSRCDFEKSLTVYNRGGFVKARAVRAGTGYSVWLNGNATFVFSATVDVDLERGVLAGALEDVVTSDEDRRYAAVLETGKRSMMHLEA